MINLNGIYFDKIRTATVLSRVEETGSQCAGGMVFPTGFKWYWDVSVNGQLLGLELSKNEAEKYIIENVLQNDK